MTVTMKQRVGNQPLWALADRAIARASNTLSIMSALCVMLMMILIVFDVSSRIFLGGSIPGTYELVETLVVFVAFLGLSYAERSRQNVRIELVTQSIRKQYARNLRIIGNMVALLIVILFAYATWGSAFNSLAINEARQGLVNFPLWPARFVIAISFTVFALELLCTIARVFRDTKKQIDGNQE